MDQRLATLRAALGFLRLPPRAPELRLLHRWRDSTRSLDFHFAEPSAHSGGCGSPARAASPTLTIIDRQLEALVDLRKTIG